MLKSIHLNELDVRKPLVVSISQKSEELRVYNRWFRIWHFQTPALKRYLQMHLLGDRFIFWGWRAGFSERGSQDLSNGTNFISSLANSFSVFTSIVYGRDNKLDSPEVTNDETSTAIDNASSQHDGRPLPRRTRNTLKLSEEHGGSERSAKFEHAQS
jgi:hypothetical protein